MRSLTAYDLPVHGRTAHDLGAKLLRCAAMASTTSSGIGTLGACSTQIDSRSTHQHWSEAAEGA